MQNQCNYCYKIIPDTGISDVLCEECISSGYKLEKYITKDEIYQGIHENNPSFYNMDDEA